MSKLRGYARKHGPLTVVLIVAAFFRFYRLTILPPGLYADEAVIGNCAYEFLHTHVLQPFYPVNFGTSGLFVFLQSLPLALFGNTAWAMRVMPAGLGTLTVWGIYLAGKELISRRVGLLAAFFLATSYWHINLSRLGFPAVLVPLFIVFGVYWLARMRRTGGYVSAVFGGLMFGLGMNSYFAFLSAPLVIVPFLVGGFKKYWRQWLVFIGAFMLTVAPLAVYSFFHFGLWAKRINYVAVWRTSQPILFFADSLIRTLTMFNIAGDPNPRQNLAGQPMLGFVIGLLFLTGVVLLMRRREKLFSRILLIWLAALLLPAIFSSGSPNALRTAGALPAAMLIAAFGADDLWLAGKTFFPTRLRSALIFTAAVILVVLPLLVGYDYFFRFARSPLTAPAFYGYIWQIADFIKSTPPDVHLYIIDNVRRSYSSGTEVANQSIVYALQNEEIASRITYLSVGQTSDLPSGEERAQVIPLDPTPPILYYLGSSLLNFKQTTSNGIIIFTNY